MRPASRRLHPERQRHVGSSAPQGNLVKEGVAAEPPILSAQQDDPVRVRLGHVGEKSGGGAVADRMPAAHRAVSSLVQRVVAARGGVPAQSYNGVQPRGRHRNSAATSSDAIGPTARISPIARAPRPSRLSRAGAGVSRSSASISRVSRRRAVQIAVRGRNRD